MLDEEELENVKNIDVSGLNMNSIVGIGYLESLETVDCSNNMITYINLEWNPLLTSLDCSDNNISTLKLKLNSSLIEEGYADHYAIKSLDCSNNALKSLDLSECTELESLDCSGNQLYSLDLGAVEETLLECSLNSQEHDMTGAETIDLAALDPDIDLSRISNVMGASFDSSTGILSNFTAEKISYDYNVNYDSDPELKMTVSIIVGEQQPEKEFDDVADPNKYYYTPVYWAVAKNITTGTSDTTFSPNKTCTRAEVVTFLYRAAGKPSVSGLENPFADVSETSYYRDAVVWAAANGITTGTSSTTFDPSGKCTRAEVVTFLYRAAGKPSVSGSENPFADVSAGSYYEKPVIWAADKGITTGTSPTTFNPSGTCSRAEVVTFLYRADKA